MSEAPVRRRVVVGVDTHKHIHVAVALDEFGGRVDAQKFSADTLGYRSLIDWAAALGRSVTFGIEGTGSYGAGLASASAAADSVPSRCCAPIAVTAACAARTTSSTPRTPPAPCWEAWRPPSRKAPTASWR